MNSYLNSLSQSAEHCNIGSSKIDGLVFICWCIDFSFY